MITDAHWNLVQNLITSVSLKVELLFFRDYSDSCRINTDQMPGLELECKVDFDKRLILMASVQR